MYSEKEIKGVNQERGKGRQRCRLRKTADREKLALVGEEGLGMPCGRSRKRGGQGSLQGELCIGSFENCETIYYNVMKNKKKTKTSGKQ